MSKYRSLENIIRTRHLTEIHRDTMNIPHNIDVPQVARDSHHIDQLHDIYHRATKMGSTDKQEVARAEEIVSKIKKIAELNKVGIEHHHLDDIVNAIKAYSMNDKEIEDDINKDKIVDIFSKLKSVQPSKKVESDVEDHHLARSKTQARFLRTKDVAEAKMAIKELSKDLIQKASLILSEKKELSDKQKEIAKLTPPEDEIDGGDLEALRLKKKKEKHPYVTTDGKEDKDSEPVSEGYNEMSKKGTRYSVGNSLQLATEQHRLDEEYEDAKHEEAFNDVLLHARYAAEAANAADSHKKSMVTKYHKEIRRTMAELRGPAAKKTHERIKSHLGEKSTPYQHYLSAIGKEDKDSEPVSEGYKKKKGHNGKKHDCATKVEHAEWGPGTCIKTMHAEPDENGHVAWYDVMFEHGIEEEVDVNDLTVLISEKH